MQNNKTLFPINNNIQKPKILDGRKLRWFDCDYNNITGGTACTKCKVCQYLDWRDWAESVGKPENSELKYDNPIEQYLKLKTVKEKINYIKSYAKQ